MLTQLVRYGRMLKVEMKDAKCHVKAHFTSEGSVFAGTITSKCHRVDTFVEIESDADPALIAALLRNAEGGCYAQAAIQQAVPVAGAASVNGETFDYQQYPRRVKRQ